MGEHVPVLFPDRLSLCSTASLSGLFRRCEFCRKNDTKTKKKYIYTNIYLWVYISKKYVTIYYHMDSGMQQQYWSYGPYGSLILQLF